MARPTWDEYFMDLAVRAATRSTCDRKHVGCVLVKDRQVIATGYNGSIRGRPHCDDVGHLLLDGSCVRPSHAEENAIVSAARLGISTEGSTCYTTHFPCWRCTRMLSQAGVEQVLFQEFKANEMNAAIYEEVAGSPMAIYDMDGRSFTKLVHIVGDKPVLM